MAEAAVYLKMECPADMLAVHFLAETGQMKGDFVQELEPPWNIWWQTKPRADLPELIAGFVKAETLEEEEETRVWATGFPESETRKAGWGDLFQKFVLLPDIEKRLADVVVLKTYDKTTFLEVVRRHFLLQQGVVEFAVLNPESPVWLIKVRQPSVWALDTLPSHCFYEAYNQVPGSDNLFTEAGWNLSAPENGLRLNRFRFMEATMLLLRSSGEIVKYSPVWQNGSTIVDVQLPAPKTAEVEEKEKIVITPVIRSTEEVRPHGLWKVTDTFQLKNVLANENMDRFAGYAGWFCADGTVWVVAARDTADRGVAGVLSDGFAAYTVLETRVFIPAGTALAPRLSEERLKQIFQCSREDYICLETVDGQVAATLLPKEKLREMEFFVTFQTEKSLKTIESFTSAWKFDFPDVKKKSG